MPKLLDWEKLQEDVCEILQGLDDGRAKVSRGSGAVKGNGDVTSNSFMAECKYRSTDGFTINRETFAKVEAEASLLGKIPLLVTRNKKKETLVTMTLESFRRIASGENINYDDSSSSDLH